MNIVVFVAFSWFSVLAVVKARSTRVIGSSDTDVTQHSYQISLRAGGSHVCGGSLISATRAVSSAHCLGLAVSSYSVLAGSSDRTVTDCDNCAIRSLTAYTRYPTFIDDALQGYPDDIAVLLFTAIGSNSAIGYVALASSTSGDFSGQECVITGWGLTASGGSQAIILQQATMTVLDNTDCDSAWPSTSILDGQLCAQSSTVSTCSGDNGGPLICDNRLAGVVSWQSSNCNPSFPSVFTRVAQYKVWIDGQ